MCRQRIVVAGLLLFTLVPVADAAVSAALPLANVLKDAKFILTAKVELVDADKPAIILTADEDLKGKFPTRRLLINMVGDEDAKKLDHRPQIFKRLAPKLPVVLFVSEVGDNHVAFAFTNGTWFQFLGPKQADPQKVVYAFTHGEPYLRRTFKGTTEEMKKLVMDGLKGKAKLPAMDPKEPPGFGPEAKQDKEPEASPLAVSLQPQRQTAKLQAGKQWAHILAEQGVGMAMSTPALSGKYAYLTVAHGAIARFGALYCIDLETHKTVWTFDAGKTMKQGYSSPVLADGRLYFGEGLHEDNNCKVYCVDAKTGKQVWDFATKSHTEATPVVAGGRVYCGAGDDGIYCLDAASGKKLWQFTGPAKLHLHVDSTPAVLGTRVYCGSGVDEDTGQGDPSIFCLDAETGKLQWLHRTPQWTYRLNDKDRTPRHVAAWASPVAADGVIYFGLGNGRVNAASNAYEPVGGLLAVDAATGKPVWPAFKIADGVLKRAALDADAVYFGSRDGHCYCLDRKTGKQRWKAAMGSPVIASPVLVRAAQGGKTLSVFVIGSEGRVACLEPQTGKADWVFSELEKAAPLLISTPAVAVTASAKGAERRLYFGACFDGLATPALYSLQDFLPAPVE